MGPTPARQLIPVRCESLLPGMFVARLDRSWLHTPFPAGGFLITTTAQVEQLRQSCHHVFVDPARSAATAGAGIAAPSAAPLERPGEVIAAITRRIGEITAAARRDGGIDAATVSQCVAPLVDLAIADAEALAWHLHVDAHGSYFSRRAVGTAATAVVLGRALGFGLDTLDELACGGLLLDLGKVAVPVPILAKPGPLSAAEHVYVRHHVERSLQLVAGQGLGQRTLEMIAGHHEHIDGSGYPRQLAGTQVPLFARIAAIADAYDAMTLDRRYAAAMSPYSALAQLDHLRNTLYDAALVTELVDALGIYPVGSAVELADGRCGLVWRQRRGHPLAPRVAVTHDRERRPLPPSAIAAADDADIVRCLSPQALALGAAHLAPLLARLRAAA